MAPDTEGHHTCITLNPFRTLPPLTPHHTPTATPENTLFLLAVSRSHRRAPAPNTVSSQFAKSNCFYSFSLIVCFSLHIGRPLNLGLHHGNLAVLQGCRLARHSSAPVVCACVCTSSVPLQCRRSERDDTVLGRTDLPAVMRIRNPFCRMLVYPIFGALRRQE